MKRMFKRIFTGRQVVVVYKNGRALRFRSFEAAVVALWG